MSTRRDVAELLLAYRNAASGTKAARIKFAGVGDADVYNITAPFRDGDGVRTIAGRVEPRSSEHSKVVFFESVAGDFVWEARGDCPPLVLQDPFFCCIDKEIVVGGVEIFPHPENPNALAWRTAFFRGVSCSSLQKFAVGPDGMKDIRLTQIADGRIAVFTRPQGVKGGRGKIGFTLINSLAELRADTLDAAPLLDHFIDEEWGGANEVHILKNGKLGVLAHIAQFDESLPPLNGEKIRCYYAAVFCFDPIKLHSSPMKIIAERKNFLAGPAKRLDLVDVIFSGGLLRNDNGKARLYCGVSDAGAQSIDITDPFLEYEAENYDFN